MSWLIWGASRVRFSDGGDGFRITFFDIGQGDAALVEFPGGTRWLIDGGERIDLRPQLSHDITLRVDRLVASHYDQDHIKGFFPLLDLRVGELATAGPPDREQRLGRELWMAASLRNIPIHVYRRNRWEWVEGVEVRWWQSAFAQKKPNNRTLVTEFRLGDCGVLFTGDIEKEVERELAVWMGKVQVLKAPHHGSRTSSTSELLSAGSPDWVVISAGHRNRYGHPHRDVTWRYRARNIDVFRTDFHGYVQLEISGSEITCRSSRGECGYLKCRRAERPSVGKDRRRSWGR